ncbi:hypothetical protein RD792_003914 [Penstemon davidsonii]|uniref:Uncharacterized protein n=1 Tax=Penstemon davidsonii TaxID=160366 RepID=A0ABR0DG06_9LAMI|nr:hypothetical protein RD792_003914 [Penstemon davidsonii]
MESQRIEEHEIQEVHEQPENQQAQELKCPNDPEPHDQSTTFIKTCFNGLNVLSGIICVFYVEHYSLYDHGGVGILDVRRKLDVSTAVIQSPLVNRHAPSVFGIDLFIAASPEVHVCLNDGFRKYLCCCFGPLVFDEYTRESGIHALGGFVDTLGRAGSTWVGFDGYTRESGIHKLG